MLIALLELWYGLAITFILFALLITGMFWMVTRTINDKVRCFEARLDQKIADITQHKISLN